MRTTDSSFFRGGVEASEARVVPCQGLTVTQEASIGRGTKVRREPNPVAYAMHYAMHGGRFNGASVDQGQRGSRDIFRDEPPIAQIADPARSLRDEPKRPFKTELVHGDLEADQPFAQLDLQGLQRQNAGGRGAHNTQPRQTETRPAGEEYDDSPSFRR